MLGDLQESNNTNLEGILNAVGIENYDLTIQTGDLVDDGGSYALWNNTFSMLEELPTGRLFAIGNHEQSGSLDPNALIYNQEGGSSYYSARYGNVFVATIAYNSFSQQVLEQLKADAQASPGHLEDPGYPPAALITPTRWRVWTPPPSRPLPRPRKRPASTWCSLATTIPTPGQNPCTMGEMDQEKGITYFICGSLGEKRYGVTNTPEFHFAKATNDYQAFVHDPVHHGGYLDHPSV